MESAIDAIISADVSGVILSWNRAATAVFGFSAEEAIGQPLELIIPERYRESHRQGIHRVSTGGPSRAIGKTMELSAIRKDGNEFPMELSLATWTLDEDRFYTGIIRDISERKLAETKLKNYAEELARQHEELLLAQSHLVESEKQAMLGRLLAGLLHEVNTPIGAMRSAAENLGPLLKGCRDVVGRRSGADDSAVQKTLRTLDLGNDMLEVLTSGTERIESVVDGLGRFINLDGAECKKQDLREALVSMLTLLEPQLGDRIRLETHFPENPALVFCNPARLNQALLNLLQNAVEAIEDEGEIRISLEVSESHVEVLIADTGRGMSPEQLSKAFEFSFTRKTGRVRLQLGLATSKRAVEEACGTLALDSSPGKGTRVHVVLPAALDN